MKISDFPRLRGSIAAGHGHCGYRACWEPGSHPILQPEPYTTGFWVSGGIFPSLGIEFSPLAPLRLSRGKKRHPQGKRDTSSCANTQPERRPAKYTGNLPSPSSGLGFKPKNSQRVSLYPGDVTPELCCASPRSNAGGRLAENHRHPGDSQGRNLWQKGSWWRERGSREPAVGKDPPNTLNLPNLKGLGEVSVRVPGSRAAVSPARAGERWARGLGRNAMHGTEGSSVHGMDRNTMHGMAQVMPGPGDVSPQAQPGRSRRSRMPQGAPAPAPAGSPPRMLPPAASREPRGVRTSQRRDSLHPICLYLPPGSPQAGRGWRDGWRG